MPAAKAQHDMAEDRSTRTYTRRIVSRINTAGADAIQIAHMRMRSSAREGDTTSKECLGAEVVALSKMLKQAEKMRCGSEREQEQARDWVRGHYLNIAASAIMLAERAGRIQP